ncbi:MAG: AraC family transcriptional regulator [Eubacteriales bacterium]
MNSSRSDRILITPSALAKKQYLYAQEVGTLESLQPHVSKRSNLISYLFLIVLDGSGTLTYENTVYHLCTGHCAFIDCHLDYAHESSREEPWRLMWVHFDGVGAASFYKTYKEYSLEPVFSPAHPTDFISALSNLHIYHVSPDFYTELNTHLELTKLITLCFTDNHMNTSDSSIDRKLSEIYDYLNIHYAKVITLDQLSCDYYISKYYLARAFKKKYGVTIITALLNIRLSHAKSCLRFSNDSIQDIALQCGFQDIGYFIKAFKKKEGLTPLVYRKKW